MQGQLRQYHTPTQLTNAAKRSETDPPKAQAQQFSQIFLWEGYLLKPGTLYGSQFVHLSLSISLSISITFPRGIVDGQKVEFITFPRGIVDRQSQFVHLSLYLYLSLYLPLCMSVSVTFPRGIVDGQKVELLTDRKQFKVYISTNLAMLIVEQATDLQDLM